MKKLQFIVFVLSIFFLSSTLAAQENYKKFMPLSYAELDSLVMLSYQEGDFNGCITYVQAAREKAKSAFGEQDSIFALYTGNLGFFYKKIENYSNAEVFYSQAIAIQKKILTKPYPDYSNSLNNLASLHQSMGNYSKAEPLYLEAIAIEKKTLGENHPDYAVSLNNLAFLYQNMGNYAKVEPLYLRVMAIQKKVFGEEDINYASTLNNLAGLYQSTANYSKAEPLYLQIMAIQKKVLGKQHTSYALSLNNLAGVYQKMELYSKAEPLYLEAISIQKKALGENHPDYALILNNLALLYQRMGDYSKAEPLHLQTIAIEKKILGAQHPSYATSLSNLALLYQRMGNYSKAEPLLLEAMEIQKKAFGEQHPSYANRLNNLATLYTYMNKLDTAFYYTKKSILANATTMDSSFADWGNLDTFKYISMSAINTSISTMLTILQRQYNQHQDAGKLELRYILSQAAIRLNERFRNDFTAEGEKLRVLAQNNEFVLSAIKTGIALKKTDYEATSFGFAEMNKGVLLLEAIKTDNALQFGNLPDTLAEQGKKLQKKQSSLAAKLLEKRAEIEKDSLRKILNTVNQEIDIFTKMLKSKYPKYAALKYGTKTASAKEIQALLDKKTALLEYLIGDSVVYIFYIDKKQVKLTPVYLSNKILNEKIKMLHSVLSDYELANKKTNASYQKYTENAYWFYETLVSPTLKYAKGIESLIIIPDGELGHLPFETFLTKPAAKEANNYKDLSYLLLEYKISYNYAASVWKSNKEAVKHKNNGKLLAMASNYALKIDSSKTNQKLPYERSLRAALQPLPAAIQEVETLDKSFNGFFAFDKDASEKNFKNMASEYAVIHLAMHGLLDSKNPILSSLAFTDYEDSLENNFLQAYEISKMELNADLVVLSACETGFGKFEKGNGTASLARAFMYAGVPAMVVSLWQVNDASTSTIMQLFYKNLAKGMNKAAALQKAKIDYIDKVGSSKDAINRVSMGAHPAFWAAFVLIGDERPIAIATKGSGTMWYLIGGVGLLALIASVFVLRHKGK